MRAVTRVRDVEIEGTCELHGLLKADDDLHIRGASLVETLESLSSRIAQLEDAVAELQAPSS